MGKHHPLAFGVIRSAAISLLALHCFSASAGERILTLPHKSVKLSNGLRVFMVKYPSPGAVSYQLPVNVGSRNEVEAGKSGFAHFFEHLMFRGTKTRSSQEFGALYARLGVENNAWTSNDMTNYHGIAATVYLPQILDAEADRFMNLSFEEKALRDEAGAVLGEYNKSVAQPEFMLEEKLAATAYKVHPYGHTTMGYKEDILKFTERYKDVWPFFKRYYRPSNVSVVLVGDLDFAKMEKLIVEKFGSWKASQIDPVKVPVEPEQTEPRTAEVRLSKPTQTRLTVGYKVPAFTTRNTDAATLSLLAEMYFSVTSEFQKEYRFEKKWLDAVSAAAIDSVDPGLWTVNLRLSQAGEGHESELLGAIEKTVARLREGAPEAARLAATKQRFRNGAITSWFGSPEELAGKIAWYTNFEPDLDVINRVFDRLNEVKAADLTAFAKKHLIDARKTTVVLKGSN